MDHYVYFLFPPPVPSTGKSICKKKTKQNKTKQNKQKKNTCHGNSQNAILAVFGQF